MEEDEEVVACLKELNRSTAVRFPPALMSQQL
jgi:hypothetical protein